MVIPLQLARMYTIIANYGLDRELSIFKISHISTIRRIFPQSIIKRVMTMMEKSLLPGGSSFKASVKGYRVAVKTGIVKKIRLKMKDI